MNLRKSVLIALTLLFLITNSVSAQSSPVYGFIPLISEAQGSNVIWQSLDAYHDIQPEISMLTYKGIILEHKPVLGAGILMVKYQPGADLSALGTVYADANEALASIQRPASEVQSTVYAPFFTILMGGVFIQASGLGADAQVDLYMKSMTGNTLFEQNIAADPAGAFSNLGPFYIFLFTGQNLPAKYKIEFHVYDSTHTTLMGIYKITLPANKITIANPSEAKVGGRGLPNKNYTIQIGGPQVDDGRTYTLLTRNGKTNSKGSWVKDFGKTLMGGRQFIVTQHVNQYFDTMDIGIMPYLECNVNSPAKKGCVVQTIANYSSQLTRVRKGIATQFSPDNNLSINLFFLGNSLLYKSASIMTGDIVSDPSARIQPAKAPLLTLKLFPATDTFKLSGPKNANIHVYSEDDYNDIAYIDLFVKTNSNGVYNGPLGFDAKTGETYIFELTWTAPKTGSVFSRVIALQP